jgi:hypothetical protein
MVVNKIVVNSMSIKKRLAKLKNSINKRLPLKYKEILNTLPNPKTAIFTWGFINSINIKFYDFITYILKKDNVKKYNHVPDFLISEYEKQKHI